MLYAMPDRYAAAAVEAYLSFVGASSGAPHERMYAANLLLPPAAMRACYSIA